MSNSKDCRQSAVFLDCQSQDLAGISTPLFRLQSLSAGCFAKDFSETQKPTLEAKVPMQAASGSIWQNWCRRVSAGTDKKRSNPNCFIASGIEATVTVVVVRMPNEISVDQNILRGLLGEQFQKFTVRQTTAAAIQLNDKARR